MRCIAPFSAVLAVLCVAGASSRSASPASLRAGAALVDLTPEASDLAIATDSIRDHLFARAVVDDGTTCAVLAGRDLGGVDRDREIGMRLKASRRPAGRCS